MTKEELMAMAKKEIVDSAGRGNGPPGERGLTDGDGARPSGERARPDGEGGRGAPENRDGKRPQRPE